MSPTGAKAGNGGQSNLRILLAELLGPLGCRSFEHRASRSVWRVRLLAIMVIMTPKKQHRSVSVPKAYPASPMRIEHRRPSPSKPIEPRAYTYQQAADAISVSLSTIKRRVRDGQIPSIRIGTMPRIPESSMRRLLGEE